MDMVRSRRRRLGILLAAAALLVAPAAEARNADLATGRSGPRGPVARAGLRDELLALTNADRDRYERRALDLARSISRYATRHSRRMAQRGELFHSSWDRLARELEGTGWQVAGENVGMGPTVDVVQEAFMQSGPHRRNVLLRAFDHAAIGVVESGGSVWITVVFYGS